jgi:UDP-GlcNAc:undecaprenyl-phosphate GlcNAc-1-phosphate transferase
MDGLASGITIIASMALLGLSLGKGEMGTALLCLALAGSCLGFLRYNFNPAKIFMGDCGSMFLGYMLAALAILGGWQRHSPVFGAFLPPVLILGVAIFDTTLVTVLRLKNGRWPWQGGRDHSSHRLVSILGGSEKGAVLVLYGMGVLAGVLGLVTAELSSLMAILAAGVFFLGITIFGIRLARVECYREEAEFAKSSLVYSSHSAQRDRALSRTKEDRREDSNNGRRWLYRLPPGGRTGKKGR